MDIKDKLREFPESQSGKHWLFWLSLAAVSLTVVHTLKQVRGR
jgi:hypothetical protein